MNDDLADSARDKQIDAAFAAFLKSCDSGDLSSREEFLSKFPELEPDLRRLISTADLLERFAIGPEPTFAPRVSTSADTIGGPFKAGKSSVDERNHGGADSANTPPLAADATGLVSRGRGTALPSTKPHPADDPNSTLPAANRPPDHPGPRLPYVMGDYELQRMIGRGGMGVVYLARQTGLDREVAVKMIRSGMLAGDEEVRRFRIEARAAARLQHPNIVTVHHFGYVNGHHYFSMDYIAGTDLSKKLEGGPLPIETAVRYVRDCARAIHYAHQSQILHRDLKPANVLIDQDDQVRITDFGLAKQTDGDSSITASGAAVGTPNYMAPEQASGHGDRAGRTADVYALGAILFALVTGRPPFVGETIVQTLMQVVHRPTPSPREFRPDVPAELETVLLKCLEKEPGQRYQSADELAGELERVLQGRPVLARRRSIVQRFWNWFSDIPIIAALAGRRFLDASDTHRRVQTAFVTSTFLIPLILVAIFIGFRWYEGRMPNYVRIAGGIDGGLYDEISGEIAHRIMRSSGVDATVVSSNGSVENRKRLLSGEIDLAPMQASTIRGDKLCVVAPLFYEVVHVLVRPELGLDSVDDLEGHVVAIGPDGSGSRLAAELLFDSFKLVEDDVKKVVASWNDPKSLAKVDAAIICIGEGSELVTGLLANGQFQLINIPESIRVSLEHPTLRPLQITPESYPAAGIPAEGLQTVGMTAFLAARTDTPNVLVESALAAIYAEPMLYTKMIPKRGAAEFQGMQLHPAARRFFDQ